MHQPDLLMGVPKAVMILILCITVIVVYLLGPWFALIGLIFYIPCYFVSYRDPLLLTMALDTLFQAEHLQG
jgi:type IV secretory pathway VirB3-like protein